MFYLVFLLFLRLYASFDSNESYLCEIVSPCSIEAAITKLVDGTIIEIVDNFIQNQEDLQKFQYLIYNASNYVNCTIEAINNCIISLNKSQNSLFSLNQTSITLKNFHFQNINTLCLINCQNCFLHINNCLISNSQFNNFISSINSKILINNVKILSNTIYSDIFSLKTSSISYNNFSFCRNFIKSNQNSFQFNNSTISIYNSQFHSNSVKNNECFFSFSDCIIDFNFISFIGNDCNKLISLEKQSLLDINNSIFKRNCFSLITIENKSRFNFRNSKILYNVCIGNDFITLISSKMKFLNIIFSNNFCSQSSFTLISSKSSFANSLFSNNQGNNLFNSSQSEVSFVSTDFYDNKLFNTLSLSHFQIQNSKFINFGYLKLFDSLIEFNTSLFDNTNIDFCVTTSSFTNNSIINTPKVNIKRCTFINSKLNDNNITDLNLKLVSFDEYSTNSMSKIIKKHCKHCIYDSKDFAILEEESKLSTFFNIFIVIIFYVILLIWLYKKINLTY